MKGATGFLTGLNTVGSDNDGEVMLGIDDADCIHDHSPTNGLAEPR